MIATLDTINICVPTPLRKTKDPDLSYVVSAVETVAAHLRPGQLVVLESTTYPGTTDEVVKPILERGGLVVGRDFFLAFSLNAWIPATTISIPETPRRSWEAAPPRALASPARCIRRQSSG